MDMFIYKIIIFHNMNLYSPQNPSNAKPQKESLFAVLCRDYLSYGTSLDDLRIKHLQSLDTDGKLTTWRDFAKGLSDIIELEEEGVMNVRKSSTWAVCQEFLGNLSDSDLWYSTQRGGIWSISYGQEDDNGRVSDAKIVSVRQILNRFKTEYPDS